MKQRRFALKIGYTVLILSALFILSVIGYFTYLEVTQKSTITIRFPETGTLKIDNIFTLHGQEVGKIKKMEVDKDGYAIVTVQLSYKLPVFKGYKVHVIDNGVFGERRVDLVTLPENYEPKIVFVNGSRDLGTVSSDTLTGESLLGISDILGNIMEVKKAFRKVQKTMRETFEGAEGKNKVFDFVDSAMVKINRSTDMLYSFATELNQDIEINLPKAIEQTNNLMDKIEDFSEKGKELERELSSMLKEAHTLIDSVHAKADDVEKITAKFDSLYDSLSFAIEVDTIEKELTNIGNQLESIGTDAHKLKLLLNRYNK